ncbi:Hyoscyamine 6-dioxygenase [Melia azedarach]|uniref:Hyoscyamine 6-dioxygenase n=1 Tax=Melia azedarach TaxID=155640 RepID=A0ACC1YUY1_MELAZ|nr:Hyoscyamine 6-dioxygenase [Melia azedarach]
MQDVLNVAKEFFEPPAEDKASLYSDDRKQSCRHYTSIDYANEKVRFWIDNLVILSRNTCNFGLKSLSGIEK